MRALWCLPLAIVAVLAIVGSARADDGGTAATPVPIPALDAGTPIDAAPAWTPPVIAVDAGPRIDARPPIDAGVPAVTDGGLPLDGGPPIDAGVVVDAGPPSIAPHASHDAGPEAATTDTTDAPAGAHAARPSSTTRALAVIKLVIGLVALMVLAYLGGHRKVMRLQERLGIGGVIAAGFPFIALGLIVRQPEIGILTPQVLSRMEPILHFGLGWLGFIIGAQLDIRILDKVPQGTAYLIVVETLAPFALVAAGCGGAMIMLGGASWDDPLLWRDLIVLGAAAAMTAPRRFRGFANRTWKEGRGVDHLLAQLDEIAGVIGLLFVAAYFRPDLATGWQLPGTAWVFVSIGLGVVIGVLIFAMVRVPRSNAEFLAVVLGSIAFGSGLAGNFFLSPIAVCFVAGALVTNFPSDQRESVFRILNHLERPIHLLFLIIVGATWDVFDWRPWALVPLFVIGRVVGKWLGIFAAKTTVGADLPIGYADYRALVTPVSALSIALVISGGGGTTWIATVVIGGAVMTELLVTITKHPTPLVKQAVTDPGASSAIDDLDDVGHAELEAEESGPVYTDDLSDDPEDPTDPTDVSKA